MARQLVSVDDTTKALPAAVVTGNAGPSAGKFSAGVHASQHGYGGADPITPASIAAATAAQGAKADSAVQPAALTAYAKTPAVADSLHTWGHSYIEGTGPSVTQGLDDFVTILGEMLGLPVRNEGIGGAALHSYVQGSGSWVDVVQKVTRPGRFTPATGLHVVMYGLNDINLLLGVTGMAAFTESMRVAVARLRAGRIYEDNTSPGVTLGGSGSWTQTSATNRNSGATYNYNPTNGATITITTPASFPGGTIDLGFITWSDGSGATISGTVNGTVYSINTTTFAVPSLRTPSVLRIPNVPAGAASYVFTSSAGVGGVGTVFDYWSWEAPASQGPLVVLVKQPHCLDYSAYDGTPPGPPTDAAVDAMNATFDAIAAEFGARVITVDTSYLNANTNGVFWSAGNVHLNILGQRTLAELVRDAIAGLVTPITAPQLSAARVEYGTAAPTTTATKYRVGDRVWNTAPAAAGYMGWVCTVTGTPGTWKGFGAIEA